MANDALTTRAGLGGGKPDSPALPAPGEYKNALVVVARQPAPGNTKTRLCPPLSSAAAAELYACLLADTLATLRLVPGIRRVIGYSPPETRPYFQALAPDFELLPQRGATLGERLDNLLTAALTDGAEKAVVMCSDSPTLPAAFLALAFEQLEVSDLVVGPADDGGYYLIGMKRPLPQLLRQVQMSTPHVLRDTLDLAGQAGLVVSLLPSWYDIDTLADLQRLNNELHTRNLTARHSSLWLAANAWQMDRVDDRHAGFAHHPSFE